MLKNPRQKTLPVVPPAPLHPTLSSSKTRSAVLPGRGCRVVVSPRGTSFAGPHPCGRSKVRDSGSIRTPRTAAPRADSRCPCPRLQLDGFHHDRRLPSRHAAAPSRSVGQGAAHPITERSTPNAEAPPGVSAPQAGGALFTISHPPKTLIFLRRSLGPAKKPNPENAANARLYTIARPTPYLDTRI